MKRVLAVVKAKCGAYNWRV